MGWGGLEGGWDKCFWRCFFFFLIRCPLSASSSSSSSSCRHTPCWLSIASVLPPPRNPPAVPHCEYSTLIPFSKCQNGRGEKGEKKAKKGEGEEKKTFWLYDFISHLQSPGGRVDRRLDVGGGGGGSGGGGSGGGGEPLFFYSSLPPSPFCLPALALAPYSCFILFHLFIFNSQSFL